MTGLRLAGEKAGFALFSSVCFALLHFAQCVFCTFAETEVLGSCSVWRGGTHKGEKRGETMAGKKGKTGLEIVGGLEGGKSRFCSFPRRKSWDRALSTGCAVTAVPFVQESSDAALLQRSSSLQNCGWHTAHSSSSTQHTIAAAGNSTWNCISVSIREEQRGLVCGLLLFGTRQTFLGGKHFSETRQTFPSRANFP